MPMSEPLKVSISPNATKTEWCISANGGQRKPANNSRHPNPHSIIATINWKFFFMISLSFSPRGPHEMRDLVGRAEALSALTTTVGQCTKLPNARTKVHNAIAVMSWKCFMGLVSISHWLHWFSRIWVDPKIVEYYRKLFKIYLGNKNTLRYKNFKKSMRSFCFCPNECNSLHWWAKQKEI